MNIQVDEIVEILRAIPSSVTTRLGFEYFFIIKPNRANTLYIRYFPSSCVKPYFYKKIYGKIKLDKAWEIMLPEQKQYLLYHLDLFI